MRSEFDTLEQYQESMKEFNENTRMEFEEFIQSHGSDRNKLQLRCTPYTSKKGGYGSFDLDFGLCVYQHQQSKVDELQKRVDAFKDQAAMLRETAKSRVYTEREQNILLSQADDIDNILGLEQSLKGGSTPSLNTDENGECRHFSTTMFADSKAECFHCDAVVNEKREVIGKQSKGLNQFFTKTFSKEPK